MTKVQITRNIRTVLVYFWKKFVKIKKAIVCSIISSFLFSTLSVSARHNDDYRIGPINMDNFYNYGPYCKVDEYPKFKFRQSSKLYRTDEFPVATIGCRIRKSEKQKIEFYTQESIAYFSYLRKQNKTKFRALDDRYFYLEDVTNVWFRPEYGEVIFDTK